MRIGVLALQGAFAEHEQAMADLGVKTLEIRRKKDLNQEFDGLILPGGESTVMGKLLKELELFEPLHEKIQKDLPVLGTCAGLILLAEKLSNDNSVYFGTLPVTVKRNAYGRQLGSFYTQGEVKGIGKIPMAFIRAPYIEEVRGVTETIAEVDGKIVGVRYRNQIGVSFHPEVTDSRKLHRYFLDMCENAKSRSF